MNGKLYLRSHIVVDCQAGGASFRTLGRIPQRGGGTFENLPRSDQGQRARLETSVRELDPSLELMDYPNALINKMQLILNDSLRFKKEERPDNPVDVEQSVNRKLQVLLEGNFINEATFKSLRSIETQVPQLYGFPKLHMPGVPLRPILSMSNSPQHKAAKWLAKLLKPILDRIAQFCLKDSFELAGLLETMNIRDKYLCSFDVESLFTNVLLDECIEFLLSYMRLHHLEVGIPESELEQLLLLCTKNVSFAFQDSAYRQIDGVAMSSPLGPILADIFIAKLEQQVTERLSSVQLYKRYVDDILLIAHNQLQAQRLIGHMNSLHPNIHFSMEGENQNSLPFLDICIRRNADGSIQRSVHRKSTWTGQYLHFESFVPRSYKQSLVRTLFDRARRICTEDTVQEEMALLETTLQLNGYPKPFIARFKQPIDIGIRPDTVSKKPVFLRLPFKGDDVCQLIHRRLVSSIARTYNAVVPVILFRTFRIPTPCVKQPVPESAKSNLICEYRCRCGASYIGRTERQLRTRVTEYIPNHSTAAVVIDDGSVAKLTFDTTDPDEV
ncbi:uncharacterized protein DEA37_0003469 [Paragonimus westermani]|uniref:Reverse transcriptase domain-containing protein n=1 Tax=Paragonimus westermani TaxID=34504 RepID=A0A5J4NLX0_9TREM|nr:uncharacterized protein DEA37_0003469 [Paragonimus westermani]